MKPPCPSCLVDTQDAHAPDCKVAAAWHALGDPRGAADIERAHEEALAMARRRSDGPRLHVDDMRELRERIDASPGMQAMRRLNAEIAESDARLRLRWLAHDAEAAKP